MNMDSPLVLACVISYALDKGAGNYFQFNPDNIKYKSAVDSLQNGKVLHSLCMKHK